MWHRALKRRKFVTQLYARGNECLPHQFFQCIFAPFKLPTNDYKLIQSILLTDTLKLLFKISRNILQSGLSIHCILCTFCCFLALEESWFKSHSIQRKTSVGNPLISRFKFSVIVCIIRFFSFRGKPTWLSIFLSLWCYIEVQKAILHQFLEAHRTILLRR